MSHYLSAPIISIRMRGIACALVQNLAEHQINAMEQTTVSPLEWGINSHSRAETVVLGFGVPWICCNIKIPDTPKPGSIIMQRVIITDRRSVYLAHLHVCT